MYLGDKGYEERNDPWHEFALLVNGVWDSPHLWGGPTVPHPPLPAGGWGPPGWRMLCAG